MAQGTTSVLENIGRYTLVERLAEGQTGDVYLAVGACLPGLEKHYVVKVVHRDVSDEAGFAESLHEEVRLALRLSHPNVVALADAGCADGRWFVATEAVLGRNLAAFARACRRKHQPPPLLALLYIAREVLVGLEHCHQQAERHSSLDRVHREISAGNVLLSFDGAVKLADFGLGLSPERLRRQPADRRADVFCVGALLFELITGARFDPQLDADVVARLRGRSTQGLNPLPAAAEALLCSMLSLDARRRFANAQAAARAAHEVIGILDPHYGGWHLAELMNELFGVSGDPASLAARPTVAHPEPAIGRRFGPADESELSTVIDTGLHPPSARTGAFEEEPTAVVLGAEGVLGADAAGAKPPGARDTIHLTETDLNELAPGAGAPDDARARPSRPTSGYELTADGKIQRVRLAEVKDAK